MDVLGGDRGSDHRPHLLVDAVAVALELADRAFELARVGEQPRGARAPRVRSVAREGQRKD
jgi:hypothetical protein